MKWQLNEVRLQVFKGSKGKTSEASGNKTYFFRILDLTSQILLVDCSCHIIKVSPAMSIYNLRHLKCLMVSKVMQNPKNGICQGPGKKQAAVLVFP